ncbi:Arf-GAP with Rho-GAP domain, ANK repeat and PH domain-containing protein 1 [Frankliniella fusca]|uniref:Arf-GAP with Rho-GAP domain, ANK repeat and PH domain-containing protein 1 n=1 Tax=Frankliniella fusca TaxID=407009 RepID=A0AAE1LFL6_9NEOP|nr:Arf-GAP with Rho-GAP domain, ANK repeat and PH domain-containing protein 1 [Frankliniella fusca]
MVIVYSGCTMMRKSFIPPKSIGSKARCFVLGCKFEKFDRTDPERRTISTFHIPKKREVFEKWVQCTGRMDLLDISIESLRRTLYICELHFTTLSGTKIRKRISSETVPTWFPDGHTPLSEEAMASWRAMDHYKKYWAAFEKKAVPSHNSQRCPNLPPDSTAIYCQSTGPFPCLYCETVQPAQALDPDLRDLVPDLPAPTELPSGSSSEPPLSSPIQDSKPPLQEAVGKSLFNVVKNYFRKQETEDSKSSQKVVVIKCAPTKQSDEELDLKSSAYSEEKKLIVVKISSPGPQNTEELPLPENNTDLLEALSNCTDLGASEICDIVPSSHCNQRASPFKDVTSCKVTENPKSSIASKGDKTIRPKSSKPVFYNFQFEKKLVPVPTSFQKLHNLSKSTEDKPIVPLCSKPVDKVVSENFPSGLRAITPMRMSVKRAEEMSSGSEIKEFHEEHIN